MLNKYQCYDIQKLIFDRRIIMKTFGKRDYDLDYWARQGAYAVIQNNNQQFLCVQDLNSNLYLVGGGIEKDELPEDAVLRESIEETGYEIKIIEKIGTAERHWVSDMYPQYYQHNIGILYKCTLLDKISDPIEKEKMKWVDYDYLQQYLFHKHHLYLIKKHLNL